MKDVYPILPCFRSAVITSVQEIIGREDKRASSVPAELRLGAESRVLLLIAALVSICRVCASTYSEGQGPAGGADRRLRRTIDYRHPAGVSTRPRL